MHSLVWHMLPGKWMVKKLCAHTKSFIFDSSRFDGKSLFCCWTRRAIKDISTQHTGRKNKFPKMINITCTIYYVCVFVKTVVYIVHVQRDSIPWTVVSVVVVVLVFKSIYRRARENFAKLSQGRFMRRFQSWAKCSHRLWFMFVPCQSMY